MTDKEKAEEYVKKEVCVKICPTWKARGEKCDLFPKCHYVSSKIKFYRLGLAEGKKEKYEMVLSQIKHDREKVIEYNERLEKENAELSNSVTELTNTKTELENKVTELKAQIESPCFSCQITETLEQSLDELNYQMVNQDTEIRQLKEKIDRLEEQCEIKEKIIRSYSSQTISETETVEPENENIEDKIKLLQGRIHTMVIAFNNYECAGPEQEQENTWEVLRDIMHDELLKMEEKK